MNRTIAKIRKAWAREGLGGLVRRIRKRAFYAAKGVDFSDAQLPQDDGKIANLEHAHIFRTASVHKVKELIATIPASDMKRVLAGSFVDLGCGKGEPLYAARQIGFRRVIGVELIGEWVKIARRNMERLGISGVEVIEGDASAYDLPADLTLLFMANPFDDVIMAKVVEQLNRRPLGPYYIVYIAAKHRGVLEQGIPGLVPVHEDPDSWGVVYRAPGTKAEGLASAA